MKNDRRQNKVFVIDDDSSIGEVLLIMLAGENYNVEAFTMGSEAIDTAIRKRPDLVILDYFLPGENAEDIIERLRNIAGKELPIILMSASANGSELAKELPVSEFIPKPFQRQVMLEAISRNIK